MSIVEGNSVILLTGAINPNSFATLALRDSNIRREQYIAAINFYLVNTNFNIVFVENSGVSLERNFESYNDRLEFLTYKSFPNIPDRGKGFKELEIMNYAISNSKFIAKSTSIIKITGRLKILNINKLHKDYTLFSQKHQRLLTCNVYNTTRMDSRCFFFTKDFWPFLEKVGGSIDIKYSFERALWDSCLDYMKNGGRHKQFKRIVRISGISGGFGTPYDDNFIMALIKQVRHYCRLSFYSMVLKKLI